MVVIITSGVFIKSLRHERDVEIEKVKKQLKEQQDQILQQLYQIKKFRESLHNDLERLAKENKSLIARDSALTKELSKVKGSYQSLDSKQLQEKMLYEYARH